MSARERFGGTRIFGTPDGKLFTAPADSGAAKGVGALGGEITAVDVKRFGGGELLVSTKGGIFKTCDGGLHWRKSDAGIFHTEISSV